jgi:hypothetical protein
MEVHHHPNVEKKSFKEYFLEFLMIFLAVTMGFFAENIRENFTEHEHANTFAGSIAKDLEADSAQLSSYLSYYSFAATNVDTLMILLSHSDPQNIPSGKLYWYGLFGGALRIFVPDDATFQQMKNTGSLRYFKKDIALDISKYDRFCRLLNETENMQSNVYSEVRKLRAQIFDFKYNEIANNIAQSFYAKKERTRIDSFINTKPPLLSYDKKTFNEYVELVRSRFMRGNIQYADSILAQGSILMQELKQEYSLENQ